MFPPLPNLPKLVRPQPQIKALLDPFDPFGPGGNEGCGFFDLGCGGGIGGGGGIFGGGGPTLTMPPIGGSGGGGGGTGKVTNVGFSVGGALSSVLGIPAINWGRLAAFLLGLLLIAGGLYLIKPVQQIVNRTVKETASGLAEA